MLRVPAPALCLRALICEDQLIACGAAWPEELRVVSAAVDLPVLVEVDQVNQRLVAGVADKAGGMPAGPVPQPGCKNPQVPCVQPPAALFTKAGRGHKACKSLPQ